MRIPRKAELRTRQSSSTRSRCNREIIESAFTASSRTHRRSVALKPSPILYLHSCCYYSCSLLFISASSYRHKCVEDWIHKICVEKWHDDDRQSPNDDRSETTNDRRPPSNVRRANDQRPRSDNNWRPTFDDIFAIRDHTKKEIGNQKLSHETSV